MKNELEKLVSRKVKRIFMNEDYLKFETDFGTLVFSLDANCCSQSVFYDFYGVKKLLDNGAVLKVEEIELTEEEQKVVEARDNKNYQESISVYGYRLITKDEKLGLEVSSVFSFRNYSNGYYGGSLGKSEDRDVSPEIFEDVIETQEIRRT